MARIVKLNYFPVKGCAGVSVCDAVLTPAGLAHDRAFMVTDPAGVYRTQRRTPRLAVIRPEISACGEWLTLRAPGTPVLDVAVDRTSARRDVVLFGDPYQGIDQGDAVAGWLSKVLDTPSRLVRVPPKQARVTGGATPGTAGYADAAALLVTSLASLAELNRRLVDRGSAPLPMNRFRANIVVGGWDEPHLEDRARRISVGDVELGYAKLAIRCVVTTVDQNAGVKAGPEPIRTLEGYRRAAEGGVAFGVTFAVLRAGKLSIGDELAVSAWGESEF